MSQERITTLLTEKRSYLPPEHGKSSAWICGQDEADAICRRALEDPNDFWGARASQLIHWFKRWDKVLEADEARHKYRWFTGAKLNAAFNCIDRHLISGRRNKAALIWQGEKEMDVRCFTYQMLYTEVCRVAHALSSLHINKGEFVFIVGSSGSGKSTLMKLLLKELDPTEGDIIINKVKTNELNRRQIPYLRRNLGVVFQDFRLLPNKTVYENVAFAMRVIEAPGRIIRRNVPAVLSLVGLGQKGRSYPNQLSGGEQQRTALARAIANNPPILICDEPTGNLDPETAYGIMKLLDDINKRGTTIVMATHARDIVDAMQKRVVTLHKGHIIRDIEKGGYSDEA